MASEDLSEEERQTKEDHLVWETNSDFLYDRLFEEELTLPSLTVQWMPSRPGEDDDHQRLLFGTSTFDADSEMAATTENYLMIAQLYQPYTKAKQELSDPYLRKEGTLTIEKKIKHRGEVNKARYMPQNPMRVASRSSDADVFVSYFDKPKEEPIILHGHTEEGYALAWNIEKSGQLLSGAHDGLVCLWELGDFSRKSYKAHLTFKAHAGPVADVEWQPNNEFVFGSVGDDRKFNVWDTRSENKDTPAQTVTAHEGDVNCMSFNTYNPYLCLTGSSDKTVKLWDLRHFDQPLHVFEHHKDEVFQVQWAPLHETYFLSGSTDARVFIWNVSDIGAQQTFEDAEDGPAELSFQHAGHMARIEDASWNPELPFYISSVDADNSLQCWQTAKDMFEEDAVVSDSELE
ncbi:hypothetical protein SARC_09423 [Sphaeroforma arctica JP610]|uniref:Histone-binding protein RBBP4-like N-terminal domain-containing protein n=1 Tax=Sphaeroforma arctica JP610 TaxID=667725 RepID=A0A0L0FMY9_9EUKA|nr:hypothetical protein SARC_09423 [Sphaeroforma arctica JP610]KNC78135.1 hypothetical protein SARC_09423 [Sphaeroforma arctica JP610]|eukprot:XP_014152037.1 hypothetical protein SARC_09423 [Sphaeroforma arctica JP610]